MSVREEIKALLWMNGWVPTPILESKWFALDSEHSPLGATLRAFGTAGELMGKGSTPSMNFSHSIGFSGRQLGLVS